MSPTSPIRVGLVGLGRATGHSVPGVWASLAHLPCLLSSPNYQITALANSTVSSALASIKHHNLPPSTAAYGTHYELAKPALLAGKSVFVEWPLAVTTAEAKELAEIAKNSGSKTIVGLQARASPLVLKLRDIIQSGKIGKVLSSTVISTFGGLPSTPWPQGAEYFMDINSGGNAFTIFFGHFLDSFTNILGPFASLTSLMKTDFPKIDIVDSEGNVAEKGRKKTTPDHIAIQGTLASGANAISWLITGTEGQVEVVTKEGQWQMGFEGTVVRGREGREGRIEVVDFEQGEREKKVREWGPPGGNTARLYRAFAEGKGEVYADFEGAVRTHELLDWIRREAGW